MKDNRYCTDCESENLEYLDQFACGEHWRCLECGHENCIAPEADEDDFYIYSPDFTSKSIEHGKDKAE